MFNLSKFISVWVKGAQAFFKEGQIILSEHHMDDKSTQVLPKSLCLSFGKTIEFKVKSFLVLFFITKEMKFTCILCMGHIKFSLGP